MAYLPLPNDTHQAFKRNGKNSDNAFLLFNRYLEGEGYNFDSFETKNTKEELYNKIQKINFETASFADRAEASLNRLEKAGFKTRIIKLTSVSRLIVGLGDKNALEVGFTFHPLYGYPYIPGSSLKGLCRSWLEIAENEFGGQVLEGDLLQSKIDRESRQLFGSLRKDEKKIPDHYKKEFEGKKESMSKLGDVLFFDAIPTDDTILAFDVDIMNPHYSTYYNDPKNPPGDWYSPLPIKFLTIKEGATFAFFLASKGEDSLDKATKWLTNGLSELGIGSKSSSGYGYFQHPDEVKRLEEMEKVKEAERLAKEEAERPDWAKELDQEISDEGAQDSSTSEEEKRILGLLDQDPAIFMNKAVDVWKELEDEALKIKLAKIFFEKQPKFLNKKVEQKKGYALTLKQWTEK